MFEQQADDLVVECLRGADERCGAGGEQVVGEAVVAAAAPRLLERELRVRVDFRALAHQRLRRSARIRAWTGETSASAAMDSRTFRTTRTIRTTRTTRTIRTI
jgi:hypothetical protein